MSGPVTKASAGLESAFRDAVTRAVRPEQTLLVAFGFFQSVIGLARCLRQFRKAAGLPAVWSPESVAMLETVCVSASQRLTDPALTAHQALRLHRAIEGLSRATILVLPIPEKPRKPSTNPSARRVAPVGALMPMPTKPIPSVVSRRRPNDWDNIGTIAVRALDAGAMRNPLLDAAIRAALGGQLAA